MTDNTCPRSSALSDADIQRIARGGQTTLDGFKTLLAGTHVNAISGPNGTITRENGAVVPTERLKQMAQSCVDRGETGSQVKITGGADVKEASCQAVLSELNCRARER